jgi:two-component system phosphate regulon sensor histidine kinase PhoR
MAAWAAALALVALAGGLVLAPQQPISAPPASAPQVEQRPTESPSVTIASRDASWRAMVSAMPDPALVLDDAGIILHHNAAAADLFPRIRAGQHLSSVSRNPDLLSAVEKASDTADVITVELLDRVPVQRRVSAILTPLSFEQRVDAGPAYLVTFRDITDQEKLAQMRADFIAHASHELRTPLASLRGFVETLQGPARDDPEARDRFLGIMAAQAERMTRLIDDLLSLSRIEMHVHVPPRGTVELNEVVNFVAQSLEPVAQSSGISIEVETLPTSAFVRGDYDELVQVFQNLIQNAIRYGREGGFVRVRMTREPHRRGEGQRISVAVEDNGEGIAPEHLPRLTERFYRVSVSASRQKGGTGLGLAIVKHIVTRHRGELKIASTLGKGSTFTVLLDELSESTAAP